MEEIKIIIAVNQTYPIKLISRFMPKEKKNEENVWNVRNNNKSINS